MNSSRKRVRHPLVTLYWESTKSLRFISIPVSILAAIGISLRTHTPQGDIALMLELAPWYVYSIMLTITGLFRLYGLIYPKYDCLEIGPCTCARSVGSIIISVFSIIVWSILFVSSAIAVDFGLGLLLIIPCMIEVWLLSRAIVSYSIYKDRHKNE
jgi:hypothetical protein